VVCRDRLIPLAIALVLAGCGDAGDVSSPRAPRVASAEAGRIDPRAATYEPMRGCTYVQAPPGTGAARAVAPPVPEVSARIEGWKIEVEWRFLALPAECRPNAVLVTANSVDKLDNMATRPGSGGPVRADGEEGELTLDAPFLDLPPYEARVSVFDADGARSPVTTVPISGSQLGCADRQPVAQCIAAAEALFMRCLEGGAPRERCHPKAWRTQPPLPIEPLRDVTPQSLEVSLQSTVERMRSPQAAPAGVSCAAFPSCQVAWETPGQTATRFIVRYRMSGHETEGSSGCWIAARYEIAAQPAEPTALRTLEGWGNAFSQPSGCTSWPTG
jgi:hypothetical protein